MINHFPYLNRGGVEVGVKRQFLFRGILDQVEGAAFAIAPYTQLSKAQTQSIEVRETGGDTEEIFGPESQAAIDAFVGPSAEVKALYNDHMYFDGVDDDIGTPSLLPATDDFEFTINLVPRAKNAAIYGSLSLSSDGRHVMQVNADGKAFMFIAGLGSLTTTNSFNFKEINTLVLSRSGSNWSLTLNGGTPATSTGPATLDTDGSNIGDPYSGENFKGVITSLSVGTITWDGTSADATAKGWTVNGTPALFTGQGFDGRIATAYNQGSEAANAVQATAANQPFIATAGVLENGMRFDGSSTVLSVANFTPTVDATLAAWVKPATATSVGYAMVMGNPATTGQNRLNLNWVGSSDIIRYVSEAENIDSDAVFGGTDWTFVTITVSGKNISFFKNAVAAGTGTVTADPVLTDETLRVGSRDGAVYFNGLIDTPAIWNRVLTADEITKVYNATDPR